MDSCLGGNSYNSADNCDESVPEKIRLTRSRIIGIVMLSEVFVWEMLQVHRSSLL